MAIESASTRLAYTSAFPFIVIVNFLLQGCDNRSPSAVVSNTPGGGSPHGGGITPGGGSPPSGGITHGGGSTLGGGITSGGGSTNGGGSTQDSDCCAHCAGHPYCSPESGQCHDDKPWNKQYYLDCSGSGEDGQDIGSTDDDGSTQDSDCCAHCTGHPYCSPESGQCHDDKPWNKQYYLDCGGDASTGGDSSGGDSSGGDSSGSCADRLSDTSKNNGACIAIKDNKVMLIKSDYFDPPGSWDLPGGTNHGNEGGTPEPTCECAERETLEEAQIKVQAISATSNGAIFVCEYLGDDTSGNSPEEITDRKWHSLAEFNAVTLRYAWGEPDNSYRSLVEAALR